MSSYASTFLSYSPLGYWKCDETSGTTLADASGNSHSAALSGGYTLGVSGALAGAVGKAISFNGSSGYAKASSASAFNFGTNLTMICWVTRSRTGNDFVMGGSNWWKLYFYGSDKIYFGIDNATYGALSSSAITDTNWHMLAGTFDGTTAKVYIDGALAGSATDSSGQNPANTSGLYVGGLTSGGSYLGGTLDEVGISHSVLSATDISAIYAANKLYGSLLLARRRAAGRAA